MMKIFSVSFSALGKSLCFMKKISSLKKLTVIINQKISLMTFDLFRMKTDFLMLYQIIVNANSVEIIFAKRLTASIACDAE